MKIVIYINPKYQLHKKAYSFLLSAFVLTSTSIVYAADKIKIDEALLDPAQNPWNVALNKMINDTESEFYTKAIGGTYDYLKYEINNFADQIFNHTRAYSNQLYLNNWIGYDIGIKTPEWYLYYVEKFVSTFSR